MLLPKVIKALFVDREGYVSRRLSAAWTLTGLFGFLFITPSFINSLSPADIETILSSGDFTSMIQMIWGAYFTTDTINKWIHRKDSKPLETEDE